MLLPPLNRDRTKKLGILLEEAPFVDIGKLRIFCEDVCMRLERVQAGTLNSFDELLELQEDCHIVQWFFVNASLFTVMMPGLKALYERQGWTYPPTENPFYQEWDNHGATPV